MGRNRFPDPFAVTRIEISDGDWVEFKRELTVGDQQEQSRLYFSYDRMRPGDPGVTITPHGEMAMVADVAVALVNWSCCGPDEKVIVLESDVRLRAAQLKNLDLETFREIRAAYDAYYKQDQEKKEPLTETMTAPS
jgi:hypothetical protein